MRDHGKGTGKFSETNIEQGRGTPGGQRLARRLRPPTIPRLALPWAAALIIAGAVSLTPPPAVAQFVCNSTTPGGADGATAVGVNSVACGTNARAVGGSTSIG